VNPHVQGSQADVDQIVSFHLNRTTETASTANFVTNYGDGGWLIMHSNRRADGVLLEVQASLRYFGGREALLKILRETLVPLGHRLHEFELRGVIGVGVFGIVYRAFDHSLEREVALKEYMPASLAARGVGPAITVRSGSFTETYAIGLRSFVNEARLLARFDHPSLVKVYRFWEDNATAYMVMPYLQGVTLRDTRRRMAHPPDEPWIRSVISPILAALELLHREGVYHRDLAPGNLPPQTEGPPSPPDLRPAPPERTATRGVSSSPRAASARRAGSAGRIRSPASIRVTSSRLSSKSSSP